MDFEEMNCEEMSWAECWEWLEEMTCNMDEVERADWLESVD